jgi:hypothetical protein
MDKPITQKQFQDHCRENEATALQLEKLMPLVDLIPTLNEIVENQKATVYIGRKILGAIGIIASVLSLLYLILQVWKEIK